jgi:hypothetical protein
MSGGVAIELSYFRDIQRSQDGSTVTFGAGAKWNDISSVLNPMELAAAWGMKR